MFHEKCLVAMRRHGASGRCPNCRRVDSDLTPVQTLMDKAAFEHCRRKYAEEASLLTQVLDLDPAQPIANCALANLNLEGLGIPKDIERAQELFEEAWRSGDAKYAHNLGVCHEKQGNFAKAQELYEEAWRGGVVSAAFSLGALHDQQGNIAKALHLYEEARRGGVPEAAFNLGSIYEHRGKIAKAQQFYEEARSKGCVSAMISLGNICNVQGNLVKAQQHFEEARRNGSVDAAINLAVVHLKQRHDAKAQQLFEEAWRGGSMQAAYHLGSFHEDHGNTTKAKQLYEEARQAGLPKAAFALGSIHSREGNIVEAQQLYKEVILGGSVPAAFNLGNLYMRLGDYVQAEQFLEEARRGGDKEATYNLGVLLEGLGQVAKAQMLFDEAQQRGAVGPVGKGYDAKVQQPCEESRRGGSLEDPNAFYIGATVCIQGLKDAGALHLNGCMGHVVKYVPNTCRWAVQISGEVGLKSIQPKNLVHTEPEIDLRDPHERADAMEEVLIQGIIEESMAERPSMNDASAVNAQISETFVQSGFVQGPRVLLLKLSRRPEILRSLLLDAPELQACRDALQAQQMAVELPCKAKIFVRPEHYAPVLDAVRMQGLSLCAQHILVDLDLESVVLDLIRPLRQRPHSVRTLGTSNVPIAFSEATSQIGVSVDVCRTFIDIKVHSSLRSTSDAAAPRTVSTTVADARKGKNHRKSKGKNHRKSTHLT